MGRPVKQGECLHDEAEAQRKVIHDVNTHGWHVICVTADGDNPGWAYSIGLFHSFRHPEVVIFGLGLGVMHRVVNLVGEAARAGTTLEDMSEADLLESFRCTFRDGERLVPHVARLRRGFTVAGRASMLLAGSRAPPSWAGAFDPTLVQPRWWSRRRGRHRCSNPLGFPRHGRACWQRPNNALQPTVGAGAAGANSRPWVLAPPSTERER
jgi:hypothetical protein